jgi:hypothetical protein
MSMKTQTFTKVDEKSRMRVPCDNLKTIIKYEKQKKSISFSLIILTYVM